MDNAILVWIKSLPIDWADKLVLEVGSRNVNGSPREVIMPKIPHWYLGIDVLKGKGVDLQIDAKDILRHFHPETFDIVVSTEALEHMNNWQECFTQMVRATSDYLIVTTRSEPFPFHEIPNDYWRFTLDTMKEVADRFALHIIDLRPDPEWPGVLLCARKRYPDILDNLIHPPTPVDRRM